MRRSIILDIAAICTFAVGVLIGAATAPKRTIWIGADLCCSPITPIQPIQTVYIPKTVWEQCGGQPDDYLASPVISQRLSLYERLKERRPDASPTIGHPLEGPVTTAVLLMGQEFLVLPYDDPDRAHALLRFSVASALNYARAIWT